MKIKLPFDFEQDKQLFMRRAGYGVITNYQTGIESYVKRFTREHYPRLHAYIEQNRSGDWIISLHLDQKKPSYPGSRAHSADYDGPVIEEEVRRLEGLIKNQMDNQNQVKENEEERGFFAKLFK